MPVRLKNKTVLVQKFKESLAAVLPITLIVFVLCFYVVSVPSDILMAFVVGAVLLILGMSLFTLGTDLSMTPVGEYKNKKTVAHHYFKRCTRRTYNSLGA